MEKETKAPIERNTIVTGASLMPKHLEMIQALIDEKGYMNRSDVIRRALEMFYEKTLPDYIYKRSAKDMEKRNKAKTEKEMETIDDAAFAKKYVDPAAVILPSSDGYQYIILHGMSNMLNAVRVDTIKEFFKDYPDLVEFHQKKVADTSIASELSPYMLSYLQSQFGILPTALKALIDGNSENETNTEEKNEPGNPEEGTGE